MKKIIAIALICAIRACPRAGAQRSLHALIPVKTTAAYTTAHAAEGNNLLRGGNVFDRMRTIGQIDTLPAAIPAAPMEILVYAASALHRAFDFFDQHTIVRGLLLLQEVVESPLRFSVASTLTALVYLSGLFAGKSELYSVRSPQPTHQRIRSEDDAQR